MISYTQLVTELDDPKFRKHNLIFLGMSGSGKTYWSKLLSAKFGLNHVEIDRLIGLSEEFSELIRDAKGNNETKKLGNYFGKPWGEGYELKEKKYLEIEKKLMSLKYSYGTILDLTGSAIYHAEELNELAKTGLVIYLETSEEAQKEMFQVFLDDPKPVSWNGIFEKKDDETNEEALARCYPLLLKYRAGIYSKFADIKIPYEIHKNLKEPEQFIEEIGKRLE